VVHVADCARLCDARELRATLLPDLHAARVRRISANGIRIDGFEVIARRANTKSSTDRYTQTWFCLVHTMDLADMLGAGELADVIGDPGSATGF
jgi:hypothetical protein